MVCSKCGNNMEDTARFCTRCGQATQSASQSPDPASKPVFNPEPSINPSYPYTYNNVKKKPTPYTYNNVKEKANPKRKRFRFAIAIACLLIAVILVQLFAYPFLIQRMTFGRVSTVYLGLVDPEKSYDDGVTDSETKAVISYAAGIRRALSWQLTGHEKKVYDIAARYLEEAPEAGDLDAFNRPSGNSSVTLLASSSPNLMLISNNSSGREYSKEEIASDLSGIASMLLQRGYTKLSIALTALAAESSPIDPLIINNLTCALRADGLTEDARKLLGYAYKLSPNSPEVLTNMGNVCLDQGDAETAATWFDMALSVDDDFGLAHEGLMLYYMNLERYETAMRHMIKASETTFTPAVYKTYKRIRNLENYEDIRDNVLEDFEFSDIQKTYKRTRDQAHEDIDTPAGQIKIPKFPTYSGVESFIGGISGMHDYAMSIFTPAMDEIKKVLEMAKMAEDMLESFKSGGLSGLAGTAKDLGLLGTGGNEGNASINAGRFQLNMDYSREMYTIGLLGDYLDMKLKEPMDEMAEKLESSNDPILQMGERSTRELQSRGESQEAWLGAMANNWGNSMSLSSSTISANKASINQHIDAFYRAILPTYNEMKPLLEEYWLYAGGVIKYAGDENVFKSVESQRKIKLYGYLSIFAIHAELEAINVPLCYAGFAVQGDPPAPEPDEQAEKLEKPEEEVPMPDETFGLDFGIVELEWSDGELEVEVTALVAASVKYNHQKGTVTLAGGVGVSSGDFVPMLGGKVTATYYAVISRNGVNDHGIATKTEYSVGEGVKYKVKKTSTISTVTSAMDVTVEKAIVGGKIITAGAKRSDTKKYPGDN